MRASGKNVSKQTDRRAVGVECVGCERIFPTSFSYDQHRHSPYARGTPCCAFPDKKKINLTAAPRSNMSTAALERRAGQRMRGCGMHIIAYFAYCAYSAYSAYIYKI